MSDGEGAASDARAGLSDGGTGRAVEGYEWKAKRWKGALQGGRIGWVVPSDDHPLALDVWRDLKKAVGSMAIGPKGKRQVGEERRLIELAGGGSVQLWSGYDPDGLRGPYFDGVVVD